MTKRTLIIIDEAANYVGWDLGSTDESAVVVIDSLTGFSEIILGAVLLESQVAVANTGGPTAKAFGPPETKAQRRSRERQVMGKGGKAKGWQW